MNRREFLGKSVLAGLGAALLGGCRPGAQEPAATAVPGKVGRNRWQAGPVNGLDVVVARHRPPAELVAAALEAFGGMSAFVRPGDRVLLKPNLAWSRTPDQGATTSPEVLAAVISACQQAGAREVLVGDHTCDTASVVFDLSGAAEVCRKAGVTLVDYSSRQLYRPVKLSRGVTVRDEMVPADLLNCDVYLNLPTLKHHAMSQISLALKNQMGLIYDRGRYHREQSGGGDNLHRNIVDLATGLRPTLNILDATRALKTNGPKGPGVVEELGVVCLSPDICAVDAFGAKLLGYEPARIPHVKLAAAAGLGRHDLTQVSLREV